MAEIVLEDGSVATVDDEDYDALNAHRWRLHSGGYACRSVFSGGRGSDTILMHRVVMNAPPHLEVDHVHGNKLDNRKSQLRLITPIEHRKKHAGLLVAHQKATQRYPDQKNCARCGSAFTVNPRKRKRNKCCSADCAQALRVEGRRKQANKARGL